SAPPPTPIKTIKSLKQAKNSTLLVTDASNIALAFSLFYQKPSIIHLPAFTNIELGEDRLYSLFSFTTSSKDLQRTIMEILKNPTPKEEKIADFLQRDLL
ncbi:MAG: hypothetical protein K2I71_01155, partial [Helicobacter sp.]|nr:hypothetical protein [Helicobacter sp.]